MPDPSLTPDLLLHAYASGIFPMAERRDDPELFWVDPQARGVLPLHGFHISRSLARRIGKDPFRITLDQAFGDVVAACAERPETWINPTIESLYGELFKRGHAHSIELWEGTELVGGVYGVTLGGAFFGESMFSRRTDASKIALAYLVDHLARQGFTLFDTQFLTSHLASLGAVEVTRAQYHRMLHGALQEDAEFGADLALPSAQDLLQRMTQTS